MGRSDPLTFPERLKIGKAFEEAASYYLHSQGFPLRPLLTAKGQWEHGENLAHVEIKFDQKVEETGNLFIETRERRDSSGKSHWREAGIYDQHNPWFYLIGDSKKLWLLNVRELRRLFESLNPKCTSKQTATAEGFIIPKIFVDQIAIKTFENWHVPKSQRTQ